MNENRLPLTELRVHEDGFTILEVVLTLSFILILSLAATNIMRSTIDKRQALAQSARITHRISFAMEKIADDLQHAFILSSKRTNDLNSFDRRTKTIFKVVNRPSASELIMTTMNHRSILRNSHESDQSLVIYRLQEAKDSPGRTHLYRGESKSIPENFSDEPTLELFARDIKKLSVFPWKGDSWENDKWDSGSSDYRDKIPKMVRVELEAWEEEANEKKPELERVTVALKTIIHIPRAFEFKEAKDASSSIRYY